MNWEKSTHRLTITSYEKELTWNKKWKLQISDIPIPTWIIYKIKKSDGKSNQESEFIRLKFKMS